MKNILPEGTGEIMVFITLSFVGSFILLHLFILVLYSMEQTYKYLYGCPEVTINALCKPQQLTTAQQLAEAPQVDIEMGNYCRDNAGSNEVAQ